MENSIYPLKTSVTLEVLLQLKYGVKVNPKSDSSTICVICAEDLKDTYVLTLPCGDCYHRNCIMNNIYVYKRTACPSCHEPMHNMHD
mgnify:FL=1